jgi:hypothetical protein
MEASRPRHRNPHPVKLEFLFFWFNAAIALLAGTSVDVDTSPLSSLSPGAMSERHETDCSRSVAVVCNTCSIRIMHYDYTQYSIAVVQL